jgi:hypothetical protein
MEQVLLIVGLDALVAAVHLILDHSFCRGQLLIPVFEGGDEAINFRFFGISAVGVVDFKNLFFLIKFSL